MTAKQKKYKTRLIQKVHMSKLYREIYIHDRDLYESMLQNHFGTTSSKKLDIDQLSALLSFFDGKASELPLMIRRSTATLSQVRYIKELWGQKARNPTDDALREFVKRITKNNYLHIDGITAADAQKTLIALKALKAE